VAARFVAAVPLLLLVLGACGGTTQPAAGGPCLDEDPGKSAIYANRDVAFGWDAGLPEGAELQSARHGGELRTEVRVEPASGCPSDWTAYPGGLAFSGRRCVRLRVEGPGEQTGSALFGLRRDCSR
jgi:hypothetical protein